MADLVPVIRPDGRVYRPRKPPRATIVDVDGRTYVYVLGTHDEPRGRALAQRLTNVDPYANPPTWQRLAIRNGERWFVQDDVRGAPCLIFEEA
jgi:hypothetical protein